MQGKTINGFELKSQLGVGGMAEVWYAENRIGKKAAVKLLLSKLCSDENVVSRFLTEAKVMVELNHPNIRQVYDYGELDGRPAIVMEYLDGMDLKTKLKRGRRFTDEELKKWWNQLVSALNYTHQKGIVHRDIKPGNIFVDTEGNIKLLDFGIAKLRESISSTQTGQKIGTLMYMSPEQVKDSKRIDYRTDIYSLAVTFVHLLTGKKPYDSDTSSDFEISEQIVYKPLALNDVPNYWREFLTPYLNKEASERPPLQMITDTPSPKGKKEPVDDDEGTIIESGPAPKKAPQPQPQRPAVKETPVKAPAPAPVETPKKPQDEKNKSKGLLIGALCVLVVLLGAGVIYNMVEKSKEKAARIERLKELHAQKVKMCDTQIDLIIKDGEVIDDNAFLVPLITLQELEKMEQSQNFRDSGIMPVFKQKFARYRDQLIKAEKLVSDAYNEQVRRNLVNNSLYKELQSRLALIQDILKQSEKGSAVAIVPPKERN